MVRAKKNLSKIYLVIFYSDTDFREYRQSISRNLLKYSFVIV